MPELKTNPMNHHREPWLPSFDLHEENGELVLHADLEGFSSEELEISLDGDELSVLLAQGENGRGAPVCHSRLPAALCALRLASASRSRPRRNGHEVGRGPRPRAGPLGRRA